MDIHEKTVSVLKELIWFKLQFDISHYLSSRAESNWREFEREQHEVGYPIKGCGLIASQSRLAEWSPNRETLLNLKEDLAPEETGSEVNSFPRASVSIVYVFSVLEGYGDFVCDVLNPGYRNERQAWHHRVWDDADMTDPTARERMIQGFCRPFRFSTENVPMDIVSALVSLKSIRNRIVHRGDRSDDFEFAFRSVVAIMCAIYFAWSGARSELKIFPWFDYEGKYRNGED